MREIWRPVPGYQIEASDAGRLRTLPRSISVAASHYRPSYRKTLPGRILNQWPHKGRCSVSVRQERCINVGRLICLAFHGTPPAGKPNALHRDDDSWNNVPDNLYWGNQTENAADADLSNLRRGQKNPAAKLTDAQAAEIKARRISGERGRSLAEEFGISQQTVCDIFKGRHMGAKVGPI